MKDNAVVGIANEDTIEHYDVHVHVQVQARLVARLAGARYVRLYTRLWNEDEQMMQHRQTVLDENAARRRLRAEPETSDGVGGRPIALGTRIACAYACLS